MDKGAQTRMFTTLLFERKKKGVLVIAINIRILRSISRWLSCKLELHHAITSPEITHRVLIPLFLLSDPVRDLTPAACINYSCPSGSFPTPWSNSSPSSNAHSSALVLVGLDDKCTIHIALLKYLHLWLTQPSAFPQASGQVLLGGLKRELVFKD